MLCLLRTETDPYFNIAAEEYVLKEYEQDAFMLWRNEPCVVIGKHQNAAAEANARFLYEHKIPLIRRISGGGTVYHDPGNLNYSFVVYGEKDKLVDYQKYTAPILEFLRENGVNARFEEKNSLFVDNWKFSGNSAHVYKNKIIHHGTLLFNSELVHLRGALRPGTGHYNDRAVQSNPASVANLKEFFPETYTISDFMSGLMEYIEVNFDADTHYFDDKDEEKITDLAEKKYSTWEWNYGYSPDYSFINNFELNNRKVKIDLSVKKGLIEEIAISLNDKKNEFSFIEKELKGRAHYFPEILRVLDNYDLSKLDADMHLHELTSKFF
jgi:lipoate---protein ligase